MTPTCSSVSRRRPGTSLAEMDRVTEAAAADLRGLAGVESVGMHTGRAVGADEIVDVDASEIWLRLNEDADHAGTLAAIRSTVRALPGAAQRGVDLRRGPGGGGERHVGRRPRRPGLRGGLRHAAGHGRSGERSPQDGRGRRVTPGQVQAESAHRVGPGRPGVGSAARPAAGRCPSRGEHAGVGPHRRQPLRAAGHLRCRRVGRTADPGERRVPESLLVHTPTGEPVRLGDVARVAVTPTPTVISHDGASRSLDVTAQVRGRDVADVAAEATSRLQEQSFPLEYRAEVLGDAVQRADARQQVLLAVVAAAVLSFLLLQAATSSWRIAMALFLAAPLAAAGAVLVGALADGQAQAGLLAALLAVVALTVRQSLGVVRRAQDLLGGGGTSADALRGAVREQSPAVLVTALGTAAAFLPAAVGRRPGTRAPPALRGGAPGRSRHLRRRGDRPRSGPGRGRWGTAPAAGHPVRHARWRGPGRRGRAPRPGGDEDDNERETGAVMRTARPSGIAALFVAGSLGLAGCQSVAGADEEPAAPASVAADPAGGPARLTLTEDAVTRIGLETVPVAGQAGALEIPYAAVVYEADGGTWTFVELEPGVYRRAPITIATVDDDTAVLTEGPRAGTAVVTVGAAELVGVEAGISGQ